jgi:hypothetical protein
MALLAISLLVIFWITPARAQGQDGGWSEPYRLSSPAGAASEAYLLADQYGYLHCFWKEILFENGNTVIKYARFDGATWTQPNDIYLTNAEVRNISPFVDQQGILYIAWPEGGGTNTYFSYVYTYAPANNALSTQNWARPLQTRIPARNAYMRIDSEGVFHLLYINQTTEEAGVYHMRSEDKGITWSEPVWLDPDILLEHTPDSLNFEIDEKDVLHAVWWYGALGQGRPDWVRYSHSLDGGHTWSAPFMIDRYVEETDHEVRSAAPRMIIQGQSVHVIWAGGDLPYRNHRYSTDGGRTWSPSVHIFGELHGQAGDGLAVDRSGRIHFFGQIRYPLGIRHAYWDHDRWSTPELVFLVTEGETEPDFLNNRDLVHAHDTIPVVRAGNQLVLTFTDPPTDPNRRLFVMYRTLDDIPPLEPVPTPVPSATPIPIASPTAIPPRPSPTPTATVPPFDAAGAQPFEGVPAPDLAIRAAIVPTLLVLAGAMIFRFLNRRRD